MRALHGLVASVVVLAGCIELDQSEQRATARLDPPTLSVVGSTQTSITLRVCGADTTGAPAGFSVQWKTAADYAANSWANDVGDSYCAASFSGVPSASTFNLAPGECVDIEVGNFDLSA